MNLSMYMPTITGGKVELLFLFGEVSTEPRGLVTTNVEKSAEAIVAMEIAKG